jgi:prophage regulatory protein
MARSFLRLPNVKARTGLGKSSIYLGVTRGDFPAPISLGARAVAWLEDEIEQWIANRVERSRPGVQRPAQAATVPGENHSA